MSSVPLIADASAFTEGDLIRMINATFLKANARPLGPWLSRPGATGAVVSGEASFVDGLPIGPYVLPDCEPYDGYVHTGFEAWCAAQGCGCQLYEPGTLLVYPTASGAPF